MFNDMGEWTEEGVAVLGTYLQEMEMYKNEIAGIDDEINKLKVDYGSDLYSEQEYNDKWTELNDQRNEYLKGISDSKEAVEEMYYDQVDAVEEYINECVDAYNEYIDLVREALDAERELYEFKKGIEEQTKDISELERKIAALSGSDNAADIAERRRLEAELYDAKVNLSDTYYDHAKDQQQQALDNEATAYEESMNNYIETLRTTLDQTLLDTETFMTAVSTTVMQNAEIVLKKYQETGVAMTEALADPWNRAIEELQKFGGKANLGLMNQWTTKEGYFGQFKTNATSLLTSPWTAGKNALIAFKDKVKIEMQDVVASIKSNVSQGATALKQLATEIKKINDTPVRVNTGGAVSGAISGGKKAGTSTATGSKTNQVVTKKKKYNITGEISSLGLKYTYKGAPSDNNSLALKTIEAELATRFRSIYNKKGLPDEKIQTFWDRTWKNRIQYSASAPYYAKGTLGTKKDEWAITDEPWFGNELTMYATKQGTLSYMRAGSTVVPADLTKELMAIGEVGLEGLTAPKIDSGVNVMTNVVNKPELNISFDSLVHVDNCSQDTLENLEKMVDTKINQFSKQMNYAIKKFR